MKKEVSARSVAAEVLTRVERDHAFASAALDAEIARSPQLGPRDRALATELAYGSLRVRRWLEGRLGRHATRPIEKLDPRVRVQLVLAAFQLFFLERVPKFAAVSEAVSAVRTSKGPEVAAFANAILRKLAREAEAEAAGLDLEAVAVESAPPWLFETLSRSLGPAGARAYLRSALMPPPNGICVHNASARDHWLNRLRDAAPQAEFEAGTISPHAIRARSAGRLHTLPGYAEGAWTLQEEGSQLVALALGARPGDAVLDACAGRGNKTAILAGAVGPTGAVDAADLHPAKLVRLRTELTRLGLTPRATYAVDWSVGAGEVAGTYDRILVDAPCSGTGTLGRRPDLYIRRAPDDLARLTALQVAILSRTVDRLKPGGRLVYVVCSVLREEGEEVVERLLAARPEMEPTPFEGEPAARLATEVQAGDTKLRLLPHKHGTDGYFLASLVKRAATC
ncbi:16S rRNA (cytosine(967)-C(5))-methyltransferase RsmB [Pendulispora albinea]|uniref:16S rRNA (cytosine(967)-C(5))-methyltransferase n=1 Tax=Pendulispora albinea TaxID=2741071 RepID=A0ABZ2M3E1_9BACT